MRIGRIRKKIFWATGVLALVVLFGGLIFAAIKNKNASAADWKISATITSYQETSWSDGNRTRLFRLSNGLNSYCANHQGGDPAYNNGGYVYGHNDVIRVTAADNDTSNGKMFKIIYYGERDGYGIWAIHYALDMIYTGNSYNNSYGPYAQAWNLLNHINGLPIPEGENELYIYDNNGRVGAYDNWKPMQAVVAARHTEVQTFSLSATKVWNDNFGYAAPAAAYAARPDKITFSITGTDGTSAQIEVQNNGTDTWGPVEFTGLKKGYEYTISEVLTGEEGYGVLETNNCSGLQFDSSNKTCTITNKLKSVTFHKIWEDNNATNRPVVYFCLIDESDNTIQYDRGCQKYDQSDPDNNWLDGEWWGLPINKTYSVCEISDANYERQVGVCNNSQRQSHNVVNGYSTTYSNWDIPATEDEFTAAFEVTNTKNVTELHVQKNWNDENADSRPDNIYVCLTSVSNGVETIVDNNCVSISKNDTQSHDFTNLPDDGTVYSACEVTESVYNSVIGGSQNVTCDKTANPVTDYLTSYQEFPDNKLVTITNTKTEKVFVNVTKIWQDDGHESLRPNKVDVTIEGYVNGVKVSTYTGEVTPATGEDKTISATWRKTFGPYDKKYNDYDIEYRVTESFTNSSNYTTKYESTTGDHEVNYSIYNAVRYIRLTKTWGDSNMRSYRPENVSFNIERSKNSGQWSNYGSYTAGANPSTGVTMISTSGNRWIIEFGPLPYYDSDGSIWNYRIKENFADGYNSTTALASGGMTSGFTIGNGAKFIEVFKEWDDQSDVDGKRPDHVDIEIVAKVNGQVVSEYSHGGSYSNNCTDKMNATVSCRIDRDDAYASNSDRWRKVYGPFWKYDANGNEITYEAREILPDGSVYTLTDTDDSGTENNKRTYYFTNSYKAKTKVKVIKHWGVDDALPASLPEAIRVSLYKNGILDNDHKDIIISVSDEVANAMPAGTPASEAWYYAHVWSKDIEDLDKYDEQGNAIVWTVAENLVGGYSGSVECSPGAGDYSRICNITNVRTDNVDLYIYKDWVDENDDPLADDIPRPNSIRFTVLQWTNATPAVSYEHTVLVQKDATSGAWWGKLENLPRYDSIGREYQYSVHEMPAGQFEGTVVAFENENIHGGRDAEGNFYFSASNKVSDHTNIVVEKCWLDNKNRYETRPSSLTFNFTTKLDGEIVSTDTFTLTSADLDSDTGCWRGGIDNLPTHDGNGKLYSYTLEENSSSIEQDTDKGHYVSDSEKTCNAEDEGYVCTFTNRLVGTTSVAGTKTWLDGGRASLRPETLALSIYQAQEGYIGELYDATPTWTKNSNNTWTYTYSNLPLYNENGIRYEYRVEETNTQNAAKNGDVYVSQATARAGDFKNLLTGKLNYCGKKIWVDSEAPEGLRPEDITVGLTRSDGEYYTTTVSSTSPASYELLCDEDVDDSGDVWYFVFEDLDKYDDNGNDYEYILSENAEHLDDYITSIVDNEITNTYTPHKTSVIVDKIWLNDEKDDRPGYIDVTLYRNGEVYDKVRLSENAEHKWTYTWTGLDDSYKWTVLEDYQIPNYHEGWYEYESKVDGTYIKIFNQKIEDGPDTSAKNIYLYAIPIFSVLAGGMFATRLVMKRH